MASIKDRLIDECYGAWKFVSSSTKKLYCSIASSDKLNEGVEKTKEFYQNHTPLCVGAGVVITVGAVLLVRRRYNK